MTDHDRSRQLAMALQALEDCKVEFAEARQEFKDRMTRLTNQVQKLKRDILTGQQTLPIDGAA